LKQGIAATGDLERPAALIDLVAPDLPTEYWIGFDNFVRIGKDPLFWNALGVTLEYVVLNIGFQTIIAIVLAVMMQRLTKSVVLRGALLLPWLVSNVIAAMVWFWLLDYQIGLVNQFLEWTGANKIAFFGDSFWAIPTIAFVNVWRHMGYTALLVFAGLQTIPKYIYEAASIDGANRWETFRHITIPLLSRSLALSFILCITGSMLAFDQFYILTQGGPDNSTMTIVQLIYHYAFQSQNLGTAAATSVVLLAILLVLNAIQFFRLRGADEAK